jgi:hypothetical protein
MIKREIKEYFTGSTVINKRIFTTDAGYLKSSEVVRTWPEWKKEIVGSAIRKKDDK